MKLNLRSISLFCAFLFVMGHSSGSSNMISEPPQERRFDPSFKERYSGRKFNYEGREVVRSSTSKFGDHSKYSEHHPDVKEVNNSDDSSFDFNMVNGVFIFILVLAVGYLAYILLKDGSSSLFSKKINKTLISDCDISAENIQQVDIKALIRQAENENNYRLAIRYYYLLVLKQLSVNKYIIYKDDKTNQDYLEAIASQKFSANFAHTSYIYNYTWYGEFVLNPQQYQVAKDRFVQLIKTINR